MSNRITMTVTMQVTVPQALALQAMFQHWNRLASMGSSRDVSFYVDGDGNFKPRCEVAFNEPVPELTEELAQLALVREHTFDFDAVAWKLREAQR